MKYDLSSPLYALNGDIIPNSHIGRLLAELLAGDNKLNPLKAMGWALSLSKDSFLEVDDVDKKIITEFVEKTEQLANIAKYGILKALETGE